MRKRSARIEALLGEMMPLAHAVANALKPGSEMSRLLTSLYSILCDLDDEAFQALLETLRAEGLTNLWQFCWEQATAMACEKVYENDYRSLLIAVPFLAPWPGQCSGAERKALSQTLKKLGVIPPRGKIHWVQKPQSIYRMRDTSPLQLWALNTPGAIDPYPWNYGHVTTPTMYLLVGRLEFPEHSDIPWPDPEWLIQAQSEALGWPAEALDACAPLSFFLEQNNDEDESIEDPVLEIVLSVAAAAKNRIEQERLSAESCTIFLEEGADNCIDVSLQSWEKGKTPLCSLDYMAAKLYRVELVEKLKHVLEGFGFSVEEGGSMASHPTHLH
ncbi:hypothetical protein ACJU26_08365 [Acidithiobacillus sp. M4-SHS-6]|uniref:hypothetical protein n=1 Tax=Acidithiobacillus sp. M4-SHS-6 TaxID=3383024 RepID=UPI0039BE03DE